MIPRVWETQVPLVHAGRQKRALDHFQARGENGMLIDGHILVMGVEIDEEGGVDWKSVARCEAVRKSRRSAASSSTE